MVLLYIFIFAVYKSFVLILILIKLPVHEYIIFTLLAYVYYSTYFKVSRGIYKGIRNVFLN